MPEYLVSGRKFLEVELRYPTLEVALEVRVNGRGTQKANSMLINLI